MCKEKGVLSGREEKKICPVRQDKTKRASRYNNTVMDSKTVLVKEGFARQVSALRIEKGLSARELSLSIGQGAGYINNIENGNNLPSMSMFFEICEALKVSPREFFLYAENEIRVEELLLMAARSLSSEDKELLLRLARKLGKDATR